MNIDFNTLSTVLAIIGSVVAIVIAIKNRGKTDGTMQSDIGYITAMLKSYN